MNVKIESSWQELLQTEFEKPYFNALAQFVKSEYADHVVYPPAKDIFNAFDSCPFDSVRLVILGQDPYHGPRQANGLCFSVNDGIKPPPSLVNIFKEVSADMQIATPSSGNLLRWAQQGVLLLNATLTVRASMPGSHQEKGWEIFTDTVVSQISTKKESVVFLLWGAYALKKGEVIDRTKHCVLSAPHPSPFSVHRGFLGCRHFSQANAYLKEKGFAPIHW